MNKKYLTLLSLSLVLILTTLVVTKKNSPPFDMEEIERVVFSNKKIQAFGDNIKKNQTMLELIESKSGALSQNMSVEQFRLLEQLKVILVKEIESDQKIVNLVFQKEILRVSLTAPITNLTTGEIVKLHYEQQRVSNELASFNF